MAAFTAAAYLFVLSVGPVSPSAAKDGSEEILAKNLPPHIVFYLSDNAKGHEISLRSEASGDKSLTPGAAGMTFTHAVASASGVTLGSSAFKSGKVLADPGSTRTLADFLKLKGYRLLSIGGAEDSTDDMGDFQFDVVAKSIEDFGLQHSSKELTEYLMRESQSDHRPICLIVRDRNSISNNSEGEISLGRNSLENVFEAVRQSLPKSRTIFISAAICGSGMFQGADVAARCPLNIPLTIVWDSHIPAGRKIDALVSAVDVLPTLVELIGATPPSEIDGRSFASVLRGESLEHRDVAFSVIQRAESDQKYCVHDSRFLYIAGKDATDVELFDLLGDPKRERNLADDPNQTQRCQEMRDQLNLWLQRHGKPVLPDAPRR